MPKSRKLQPHTILAAAQTPGELRWICEQFKDTKNVRYNILLVGDATSGDYLPTAENVKFLSLSDLDIDNKKVWQQFHQVKDEFNFDTGRNIEEQLHLVSQIYFRMGFSDMAYMQAAIEAFLSYAEPDEIMIPPVSTRKTDSEFFVRNFQNVFFEYARTRSIKCRIPFFSRLFYFLNPAAASLKQILLYVLLLIRDTKRTFKHLFAKKVDLKDWTNAILIVNAGHDLPRQFDLSVLSGNTKEKCVVWSWEKGEIETLENFLSVGTTKKIEKLDDKSVENQIFPTSAFKLVKNYFSKPYCSPISSNRIQGLEKTYDLMKSRGFADEKLFSWIRIVYASRLTARSCDVLRVLKPKLVIASDSIDGSRAISIAARKYQIPVLATTHSISLFTIPLDENFALGSVHCLFSATEGHMINDDLPDSNAAYLVAHDNLSKVVKKISKPSDSGKFRIFLLTSMFSYSFLNWTNEIFVKWDDYDKMLRELLVKLSPYSDKIEIVIKSHPKLDNHKIYDRMKAEFPDLLLRNWREPLDLSETIPADLVVLYNTNSTLIFSAFEQDLPVLGFWGALTPIALDNLVISQLYGTGDVSRLVEMILEIAESTDGETGREARKQAKQIYNRFVEPAEFDLNEAVEYTLNRKWSEQVSTSASKMKIQA